MPDATYAIPAFHGGEISQFAQGRFDKPDYRVSLNVCLNSFPVEIGSWVRRPGTTFAQTTRNGAEGRVIKFDIQQANPYQMEFTNGHLRFFSGTNLVTTIDGGFEILNMSAASPTIMQLAAPVTWATGDQILILGLTTSCVTLQHRVLQLTKIDTTHFSLTDPITGANIDGSTLGWVGPSTTVNALRVLDIVTPYTAGTWASVRSVQTETVTYLLNGSMPQVLSMTVAPAPTSYAQFSLAQQNFQDGPYLDPGTTASAASILTIQGDGSYLITGGVFPDARATGLVAADIGRYVRLFNEPKQWPGVGTGVVGDIVTLYQGSFISATYWRQLTAAAVTTPGTNLTDWAPVAAAQATIWTWGVIQTVVTPVRFTLAMAGASLLYGGPGIIFNTWRLGLYSNAVGWPTCGAYHEGRLWLFGAVPNRADASVSNSLNTFSPTDTVGNVLPNSGISYVFNSDGVNPTFWAKPDLLGIVIGTQAGEWLVQAPTTGPITATNIAARRVTKHGSANIEPVRTEHANVFVKRYARKLLENFADAYSGKFSAQNLADKAEHIVGLGIAEIAYTEAVTPIIWGRDAAGALFGVTYRRNTLATAQPPDFYGWHRHILGSGRIVESVCSGPSVGGNIDALTMVTNDPLTHVRHVEIMTNMFNETTTLANAWFLDDAVRPSSVVFSEVAVTGAPYGGLTINGLWHLNGKTVQVYADGLDCGDRGDNSSTFTDFVVANGSTFVPFGDGVSAGCGRGLFTEAFASTAVNIVIGLTYHSDGQLVRQISPADSGNRNGPALGLIGRNHRFAMLLNNTRGISIGATFDKMNPVQLKQNNGRDIGVLSTYSGIAQGPVQDDYSYDGMLCWRVSRPFPASVVAISGNRTTQGQ